jgi:hypothetical protein
MVSDLIDTPGRLGYGWRLVRGLSPLAHSRALAAQAVTSVLMRGNCVQHYSRGYGPLGAGQTRSVTRSGCTVRVYLETAARTHRPRRLAGLERAPR